MGASPRLSRAPLALPLLACLAGATLVADGGEAGEANKGNHSDPVFVPRREVLQASPIITVSAATPEPNQLLLGRSPCAEGDLKALEAENAALRQNVTRLEHRQRENRQDLLEDSVTLHWIQDVEVQELKEQNSALHKALDAMRRVQQEEATGGEGKAWTMEMQNENLARAVVVLRSENASLRAARTELQVAVIIGACLITLLVLALHVARRRAALARRAGTGPGQSAEQPEAGRAALPLLDASAACSPTTSPTRPGRPLPEEPASPEALPADGGVSHV